MFALRELNGIMKGVFIVQEEKYGSLSLVVNAKLDIFLSGLVAKR